jgi:AcrR family transcriptional regulator
LAEIAKEAGVTRPTVYRYFADRHAIFRAAFTKAALRLAIGADEAMRARTTPCERAIEAVTYFVLALPNDPCLRLALTEDGLGEFTSQALLDGDALSHARAVLGPLFELSPELLEDAEEITEITLRFALSLLMVPSPQPRGPEELRAFLRRRLLPAIGLA